MKSQKPSSEPVRGKERGGSSSPSNRGNGPQKRQAKAIRARTAVFDSVRGNTSVPPYRRSRRKGEDLTKFFEKGKGNGKNQEKSQRDGAKNTGCSACMEQIDRRRKYYLLLEVYHGLPK